MPYYRVMLRGHNFPGYSLGRPRVRFGLYTTRWLQALNSRRAELAAIKAAWNDPKLAIPYPEKPEDRAWFTVEKLELVDQLPRVRGGGAVWFEEQIDA